MEADFVEGVIMNKYLPQYTSAQLAAAKAWVASQGHLFWPLPNSGYIRQITHELDGSVFGTHVLGWYALFNSYGGFICVMEDESDVTASAKQEGFDELIYEDHE